MKLPRNMEDAIADFRGFPRLSDAEFHHGASNMSSLVEVLIERFKIGHDTPEKAIMSAWSELLGKDAHRCAPERIDSQGRLVVAVANAILRRELHFKRVELAKKIRRLPGCENIRDIEFKAG